MLLIIFMVVTPMIPEGSQRHSARGQVCGQSARPQPDVHRLHQEDR
ncbi:MAG: hypothetical protein MZU91_00970 [Desulfosudis oleivorans]|nr:hypothetical protein [Desulfosudis oleivorans]